MHAQIFLSFVAALSLVCKPTSAIPTPPQVADLAKRDTPYNCQTGVDITPGHQLSSSHATSETDCITACEWWDAVVEPFVGHSCNAYTYVPSWKGNNCFLKESTTLVPGGAPGSDACIRT